MEKKYFAIVTMAIIAVLITAGAAAYYFNLPAKNSEPAMLTVSLGSFVAEENSRVPVSVTVQNNGGDAKGVVLTLESTAFGTATSGSFGISADSSKKVSCNIQVADIANGQYPVTLSYSYNGSTTLANVNPTCYVLPSVKIADFHWTKSTIKQNDNTVLSFDIKSNGHATYTDFSATATAPSGTLGLTISPAFSSIQAIGPLGTSGKYTFIVVSQNTPPGQYDITINLFSDGNEVATSDGTLSVKA